MSGDDMLGKEAPRPSVDQTDQDEQRAENVRSAERTIRDWPAAMRRRTAAEYSDVSISTFRRLEGLPAFVHLTPQIWVYLREDLDVWLARRAGRVSATPDRSFEDILRNG